MLDSGASGGDVETLEQQLAAIDAPELTPSARLLADLRATGEPFADYGLALARDYRDYFQGLGSAFNQHYQHFVEESTESRVRQAQTEAEDGLDLEAYLARYYA